MAVNITLYTVTKKQNSTYRPTQGLPIQGLIKDESSLLEPTLVLVPPTGVSLLSYNYCYIPTLSRYYWVTDMIWRNGRYEFRLKCDVLATYKADIGASSQYVLRSSAASNGLVADSIYPLTAQTTLDNCILGQNQRQSILNGYFVLGVMCPDGGILGSVTYYVLSWQAALYLRVQLLTDLSWTNVTEITDELLQTLFDPYQYIVSYKWFPVAPPSSELTQVTDIKFGYWTFSVAGVTGATVYRYASNDLPTSTTLRYSVPSASIPDHPQIARGRYLNGAPYSEYYLMMTGYGKTKLPNDAFILGYGLTIYETIDFVSGDSILDVFIGAGSEATTSPVATIHSHMGVDLPFGSSDQDILTAAGSAVSAATGGIGNLLTGNFGGAIQNIVSGVVNTVTEASPTVQKGGSSGSFAALAEYWGNDLIECIFHSIAAEDNADLGRPLCAVRTLSSLGGYMVVANPHIPISGTQAEQAEIERYLANGFFYE